MGCHRSQHRTEMPLNNGTHVLLGVKSEKLLRNSVDYESWRREWDSNFQDSNGMYHLQILKDRRCRACQGCRGASPAIARATLVISG